VSQAPDLFAEAHSRRRDRAAEGADGERVHRNLDDGIFDLDRISRSPDLVMLADGDSQRLAEKLADRLGTALGGG
jgi:hypothetical protein